MKKDIVIAKTQQQLIDLIEKAHGSGSIMLGRGSIVNVSVFSTGVPSIDVALGCGGLPQGRIMEVYGPESGGKTTTCLQFIAACQNHRFEEKGREGVAAFIDAEHALDPIWAEKLGVDMDKLLLSQPSHGEEAFSIIEMMIKSRLVDLIIVDSVAALVPQSELNGDFTDASVGSHARMMSKALRKLKGEINNSKTTVIFINQIREKVGVMFGCLHADTLLSFVDGTVRSIKEVVEKQIKDDIWSYNMKNKCFESKPIVDWHYNGDVCEREEYLHISLNGPGTKNGCMQITVTPHHAVLMQDGSFQEANSLVEGDVLVTMQECFVKIHQSRTNHNDLNGSLGEFLSGILSGDSHLSKNSKKYGASLRLRDNIDKEYMDWKANKLSRFIKMSSYPCAVSGAVTGYFWSSPEFSEFANIKEIYPNRDPMLLLCNFSWLGLAVWIMDDATYERGRYVLSIKRFKGDFDKLDQISKVLDDLCLYHHISNGGRITFDTNVSEHIANNICIYVPTCMDRKLPVAMRNKYIDFELHRIVEFSTANAVVANIRDASKRQIKQKGKYDISVADNENYMAGGNPVGVIVHNSPETTPGGRALKFYASIRGEVRRGAALKDGEDVVGFRTSMKMVKNKVAPPFTRAEFDICVGKSARPIYGIDKISSLIDVAEELKIVTKKGSHYKFGDTTLGNGLSAASAFLRKTPTILDEIRDKTYGKALSNKEKRPVVEKIETDDECTNDDDDVECNDPILDNELLDDDD